LHQEETITPQGFHRPEACSCLQQQQWWCIEAERHSGSIICLSVCLSITSTQWWKLPPGVATTGHPNLTTAECCTCLPVCHSCHTKKRWCWDIQGITTARRRDETAQQTSAAAPLPSSPIAGRRLWGEGLVDGSGARSLARSLPFPWQLWLTSVNLPLGSRPGFTHIQRLFGVGTCSTRFASLTALVDFCELTTWLTVGWPTFNDCLVWKPAPLQSSTAHGGVSSLLWLLCNGLSVTTPHTPHTPTTPRAHLAARRGRGGGGEEGEEEEEDRHKKRALASLNGVFATTTKICAERRSSQGRPQPAQPCLSCPFYTVDALPWQNPQPTVDCEGDSTGTHRDDPMLQLRLTWAPSIFGAARFGRWVVTHSSADSNLHGHRPAIQSKQHPLWGLSLSQHSGSVNPLSEHPASPALLTSHGPHGLLCSAIHRIYRSIINNMLRKRRSPLGWENHHAQHGLARWWDTNQPPTPRRDGLRGRWRSMPSAAFDGFATPIHSSRIGWGTWVPQGKPLMRCFTGRNQEHIGKGWIHHRLCVERHTNDLICIWAQLSWGKLRREPATRWLDWPFTPMPRSGYTICTSEQRTSLHHSFPWLRCRMV